MEFIFFVPFRYILLLRPGNERGIDVYAEKIDIDSRGKFTADALIYCDGKISFVAANVKVEEGSRFSLTPPHSEE